MMDGWMLLLVPNQTYFLLLRAKHKPKFSIIMGLRRTKDLLTLTNKQTISFIDSLSYTSLTF